MRRFLRVLGLLLLGGAAALALFRTDNPLSGVFQAREARRLGFVSGGERAGKADLAAFRSARDRCREEARALVEAADEGCSRCVATECLETEGARFRTMREEGLASPRRGAARPSGGP